MVRATNSMSDRVLSQIADRGEAAIVYDPAMEYLPQFYTKRGAT